MKDSQPTSHSLSSESIFRTKETDLTRIFSKKIRYILFLTYYQMNEKRTYTKIDEFTFKVEQDKHLEETMTIDKQFNYLAQCLNGLRECVKNANEFQEKFVKIVETYNF